MSVHNETFISATELVSLLASAGTPGRSRRYVRPAWNSFKRARVVISEVEGLFLKRGFDFVDHMIVELGFEMVSIEYGSQRKRLMFLHKTIIF
jgi:hypothetical protein